MIDAPAHAPVWHTTLRDESETAALGARLARIAAPGDVFALDGPLGAGKTTFARGFIRALTSNGAEVASPTYTIVQTYPAEAGELWHVDLYRVEDPGEIEHLGLDDAFAGGIVLVEWPDRLGPLLPGSALTVRLAHAEDGSRLATVTGDEPWMRRLGGRAGS